MPIIEDHRQIEEMRRILHDYPTLFRDNINHVTVVAPPMEPIDFTTLEHDRTRMIQPIRPTYEISDALMAQLSDISPNIFQRSADFQRHVMGIFDEPHTATELSAMNAGRMIEEQMQRLRRDNLERPYRDVQGNLHRPRGPMRPEVEDRYYKAALDDMIERVYCEIVIRNNDSATISTDGYPNIRHKITQWVQNESYEDPRFKELKLIVLPVEYPGKLFIFSITRAGMKSERGVKG